MFPIDMFLIDKFLMFLIDIVGGGGALSSINLTTERAPPLSNSLHTNYHFSVSYLYIICNIVLKVCISCLYCTYCISM